MRRGSERGYTFVAVLVLLAVCMLGASAAGPLWSQQVRREREQELLRVGPLYARALAAYRDSSPGSVRQYPLELDWLLLDRRYIGVQRQLRKLYPDPVNPGQAWDLILDSQQRIVGVRSLSQDAPIAERTVDLGDIVLPPVKHYSDWKFVLEAKS